METSTITEPIADKRPTTYPSPDTSEPEKAIRVLMWRYAMEDRDLYTNKTSKHMGSVRIDKFTPMPMFLRDYYRALRGEAIKRSRDAASNFPSYFLFFLRCPYVL